MVERVARLVPLPVVRGLQLGLGLKVLGSGVGLATRSRVWLVTGGHNNLDGGAIACVAACVALASYGQQRRLPASLLLFALGCAGVVAARPALEFSLTLPITTLPAWPTAAEWREGLLRAALPQLPVTRARQ